jgi:hypothetical protein
MKRAWTQSFEQYIVPMSINLLSIGLGQISSIVTKESKISPKWRPYIILKICLTHVQTCIIMHNNVSMCICIHKSWNLPKQAFKI